MLRIPSNGEVMALVESLFAEADSQAGTWSLATCSNLRVIAPQLSRTDAVYLANAVMEGILKEATSPPTRYKLAQLAALISKLGVEAFAQVYLPFEQRIVAIFPQIEESHQLGRPTIALLSGLYGRQVALPRQYSAGSPPPAGRPSRFKHIPCKTPQPLLRIPRP
jgi:hypothetical protein